MTAKETPQGSNSLVLPPAHPRRDSRLGLTPMTPETPGGRQISNYSPDLALQVCELVAEGHTLKEICADERFPHRATFQRWVINYPELRKAYLAAREMSAFAFEEEALKMARDIVANPKDSVTVRAYDIAMNQLRWSASKRNPREYGERGALNVTVPIQINTGLDLGKGGVPETKEENIYKVNAVVALPTEDIMEIKPEDETLRGHRKTGRKKNDPSLPSAADMRENRRRAKIRAERAEKTNERP